jgi:Flp pilus assembly CpaE family ATPase
MDPEALGKSILETLRARRARDRPGQGVFQLGTVLAFAQARGGIGATTLAVNLAQALAAKPGRKATARKVVLVDLDLQFGNANVLLDLEDGGGFLKLLESGQMPDATYMASVVQHHASGIDLICAPMPLAPLTAVRPATIAAMLDILSAEYDFVLIDLPRAMVDWIEPIIARTDRLVLVTDTSVPCVRQSQRMLEFYREANIGLAVEIVVNRETRPLLKSQHIREAETALGTALSNWIPENLKLARKAADFGVPAVAQYPRSDIAKAVRKLADKFVATKVAAQGKSA